MEIRNIQIEIVQGCNRLCDFCGLNKIADKRIKYMERSVFDAFVEQIVSDCKDNIRIDFAVHGEPLLHPDIVSYIQQLRGAKPKSQISIISNGIIATKELISNLFKAGINYLMFDMYDNQRHNLRLETILKNQTIPVLNFYEDNINIWSYKGHTQQNIIYTPPISTHSGNRRTRVLHTAGGNMPEEVYNKYKINRSEIPLHQRCSKPFYECSINYNGNVCLCCEDWQHSFIIGNIMTNSIHTIFNSDKMQEARYLLYNKRRDLIPLCSRCTQKSFRTGFLKIEKTFPKYNINNNKQHGFF